MGNLRSSDCRRTNRRHHRIGGSGYRIDASTHRPGDQYGQPKCSDDGQRHQHRPRNIAAGIGRIRRCKRHAFNAEEESDREGKRQPYRPQIYGANNPGKGRGRGGGGLVTAKPASAAYTSQASVTLSASGPT